MEINQGYSFWMVWGITCEGNLRWHMARTPLDWDENQVKAKAESYLTGTRSGDDFYRIEKVEWGYDNGIWSDYTD